MRREALIVGLGHIGASLACALSERGWRVVGWDRDAAAVRYCRRKGWVASASAGAGTTFAFETNAPVAIVALPEAAVGEALLEGTSPLEKVLRRLPRGALVTEVFSSKGEASARLAAFCSRLGLRAAWSHPLAGREGSGAASADASIFAGATALIQAESATQTRVELQRFWRELGCRVEALGTDAHQRRMAYGSHLTHVIAFALVHALGNRGAPTPSVLGATRVAKSSPDAWSSILLSNREQVLESVRRLQGELAKAARLMRAGRGRELRQYFQEAHRLRVLMEDRT